jgi:hypothetical protein
MPSYDGLRIKVCTASVFEGSNFRTCLMKSVGDSLLATSRSWAPSIPYEIRHPQFRMRNCRRGNTDPCIEL